MLPNHFSSHLNELDGDAILCFSFGPVPVYSHHMQIEAVLRRACHKLPFQSPFKLWIKNDDDAVKALPYDGSQTNLWANTVDCIPEWRRFQKEHQLRSTNGILSFGMRDRQSWLQID